MDALDYILKPVDKYSFALKMKRVIARVAKNAEDSIMVSTEDGDIVPLRASTVRYVEVRGHYVVFHTADGEFTQYATLKSVEDKMKNFSFAKCNRCFLVNLSFVTEVKAWTVVVDGEELQISHLKRKEFVNKVNKFISGSENESI